MFSFSGENKYCLQVFIVSGSYNNIGLGEIKRIYLNKPMMKSSIFYIIDDDRDDQDYLINILKEIDPTCECFTALNGQEGLKNLKTGLIPIPSIIFLDLNMPRINGRQFLMAIKKDPQLQNIYTIIYSTSATQKDIEETKQLGASFYLEKQPDYSVLKKELQNILLLIDAD